MGQSQDLPSLQMVFRSRAGSTTVPDGYTLRERTAEDDMALIRLLRRVGWPEWDADFLRVRVDKLVDDGWFVVERDGEVCATAMALRSQDIPGGGELGWVASHPDHVGRGLGRVVVDEVLRHFDTVGIERLHLYTEDHRLPAVHIYLSGGWVPVIGDRSMYERWHRLCHRLDHPFTPHLWPSSLMD